MDITNDEIEFDIDAQDSDELEIPKEGSRKVFTEQGDPEIDSLHNKFKRGILDIQPDFQRHFVWDSGKSSRLIESVLLDIPLPLIYLSEEVDENNKITEHVIDGQQRLTSFFSFIDGAFPNGADFRLSGLRVFTELNKKSYKKLPEELQDKIKYYKIRVVKFRKESDKELKFEIFERLNTGAVSLNDQELRNCIYRGPYNSLLIELSENKDFRYLLNLSGPDKRMKDVSLTLRFASFFHSTYLNYKPSMRMFMNNDMEKYRNISNSDRAELKNGFKNSVMIIKTLLDKNAFKRFYRGTDKVHDGYWEQKKMNTSLFDILMYSFSKLDKNKVYQNLDSIREALIILMSTNQEFIDSIELSTSTVKAVTKRFDIWRHTLEDILGIGQKEPRCFSFKIKEQLFKDDSYCGICRQKIFSIDDSAVDHIEQYWLGGKTIPENARLAHRYCNWSRPRKEKMN